MNIIYKKIPLLFILVTSGLLLQAQDTGKQLFNENWGFHKGKLSLTEAQINQAKWRKITLPHDWSIEGPFRKKWASGTGFLPGGVGWYRKSFNIREYETNKHYAIYFDGIYKNSEVWINGHYLGKRPNGFIPIQYNLTPYLKAKDNQILVKVDHSDFADSRFYTGSGIYRNVYLITLNKQHFSQWGVVVQTPAVSKKEATFEIKANFEDLGKSSKRVKVHAVLKSKKGKELVNVSKFVKSRAGKNNRPMFDLIVENPKLWSPNNPYLYDLTLSLWVGDKKMDEWSQKVGVRKFNFDADNGFSLNGKPMLIKGVCIHQSAGALGAAVPKGVWRSRLQTLKELGANAIRMSHYPHQAYIYDLCDELGFLVQDEAFDEWELGKNKWIEGWNFGKPGKDGYHTAFKKWGKTDVADMVRRDRNHPSIIMWSIGNEIDYPNDPYSNPILDEGRNPQIYGSGYQPQNPPASRIAELAKGLVEAVKKQDTTRPVTAALAGVTMSNHTAYPSELDIVGYNYQEYRYAEDHKKFPNRIIYGSENGDALSAWQAVTENKFIPSQFLWTAFDYMGEAGRWPNRSNGAGIIDLAGKPKPDFYFRKSLWNDAPMVYLGITNNKKNVLKRRNVHSSWTGKAGEIKFVTCYANTDEVELFLNGKSLGRKKAIYTNNKMISWKLPYTAGELKVEGYNNNKIVAKYKLHTPGPLSNLEVCANKTSFSSNEKETILLDVLLTDDQGNRIPNQDQEVTLTLTGPARLLGLESGSLNSHENYQANKRKTYKGRLRAYIQTTKKRGRLEITVKSNGTPEKKISIKSIN